MTTPAAAVAAVKSWKIAAAAVVVGVLASVLSNVTALLDADPLTVSDWSEIVPLVIVAVGLIFVRDSNVTSADAGAKTKEAA